MSKLTLFFLVSLLAIPTVSVADVWAEREALAKIQSELIALEQLVFSAKNHRNTKDRMRFDYQSLLNDLRKIQSGISHHLSLPMEPVIPSTIDALSPEYTELLQ